MATTGGQRPPLPQGAQWGWRWPEHVHTPLEAQELTPRPAWCPGPTGTWNDLHHQAGLCPVPATTGTSSGPTVATSKGTHRIWPSVPSASSPHLAKEAEVACREQTQTHETRAPPAVKKTPASKKTISTGNFVIIDSILNEAKNLMKCVTKRQQICRIAFSIIQKRQHSFNSKQRLGGVTPGLPGPTTGSTAPNRQSRAGGWRRHWAGRLRDQGAGRSVTLASTCESWATCTQAPACAHLNHLTLIPLNEQVGLGGRRCAHRHVGDQRGQGQPVRSERFPALSRVRPRAPRTRGEARPGPGAQT